MTHELSCYDLFVHGVRDKKISIDKRFRFESLMARKPRVHFAGAFYHVIARGNKGAKVFKTAQDYKLYLRFLKEYKKRYPFLLYAYVLMPTHFLC